MIFTFNHWNMYTKTPQPCSHVLSRLQHRFSLVYFIQPNISSGYLMDVLLLFFWITFRKWSLCPSFSLSMKVAMQNTRTQTNPCFFSLLRHLYSAFCNWWALSCWCLKCDKTLVYLFSLSYLYNQMIVILSFLAAITTYSISICCFSSSSLLFPLPFHFHLLTVCTFFSLSLSAIIPFHIQHFH